MVFRLKSRLIWWADFMLCDGSNKIHWRSQNFAKKKKHSLPQYSFIFPLKCACCLSARKDSTHFIFWDISWVSQFYPKKIWCHKLLGILWLLSFKKKAVIQIHCHKRFVQSPSDILSTYWWPNSKITSEKCHFSRDIERSPQHTVWEPLG